MRFDVLAKDQGTSARAGILQTAHGNIETPIFMPVGTAGTVKAVHQRELKNDIRAQIILGNTYHLFLRPGLDLIEKAGGLHILMVGIAQFLPTAVATRYIHWLMPER